MYQIGDILHFQHYFFTDTNTSAAHFALIILPPEIMDYVNNVLCAVITSKVTKRFALLLRCDDYGCFTKDSYVCLDRRDINALSDVSARRQPVGRLKKSDVKKCFRILQAMYYSQQDVWMMAVIIREWKKVR